MLCSWSFNLNKCLRSVLTHSLSGPTVDSAQEAPPWPAAQLFLLGIQLTHSPSSLKKQHSLEWGTDVSHADTWHSESLLSFLPPIKQRDVIHKCHQNGKKLSHLGHQTSTSKEVGVIIHAWVVGFPPLFIGRKNRVQKSILCIPLHHLQKTK